MRTVKSIFRQIEPLGLENLIEKKRSYWKAVSGLGKNCDNYF